MSEIKVNNGNIEDALKRFKRQCARNGVLQEVRKREHYEKPSVKRKKKYGTQEQRPGGNLFHFHVSLWRNSTGIVRR